MARTTGTEELNLATHRAERSRWQQSGWDGSPERIAITRLLVGIGGGVLVLKGLRTRTWRGSVLAGLGGTLAWWALTGKNDLSGASLWFGEFLERMPRRHRDIVEDMSDQSFPASDAPSH